MFNTILVEQQAANAAVARQIKAVEQAKIKLMNTMRDQVADLIMPDYNAALHWIKNGSGSHRSCIVKTQRGGLALKVADHQFYGKPLKVFTDHYLASEAVEESEADTLLAVGLHTKTPAGYQYAVAVAPFLCSYPAFSSGSFWTHDPVEAAVQMTRMLAPYIVLKAEKA